MIIQGTVISSGRETRMRADAAAIRQIRNAEMQAIDAERQEMYRLQALKSAAEGAESSLADIIAEHNRRAADIAGMREDAAESGRINPGLAAAVATMAEYPAIIAGSRARAEVARAAYDAEVARQSTGDDVEAEAEAEPVADAPRGRGRPSKVVAR